MTSPYWLDAAERVAWTAAEAGAGAAIDVLQSGTVTWRAVLYAVLLAVLKVLAAKKIGQPDAAIKPPALS